MIKSLTLENIADVDYLNIEFNSGLNIIQTKHSEALAYALGYITNNSPLCKAFPALLKGNMRISSDICIDRNYTFDTSNPIENKEISSLFNQSREEDNLCFYQNGKFKNHALRLSEYKDFEYFYSRNRFIIQTKGACTSRTFRGKLWEYIKNFKPQRINPKKDYFIKINEKGEFFVDGNPNLSASELNLFDFLCYLNVIEFWESFQEIKDLNHIKKPIIITELFEMIDQAIPKSFILQRLEKLNRQVFLIERK